VKNLNWIRFLRDNDLPNWLAFTVTIIIWPLLLVFWANMTYRSIPGLEITFNLGKGTAESINCLYLDMVFCNNTGKVVYLTDCRVANINTKNIDVNEKAKLDIVSHSYELKFVDENKSYTQRYIILQTNETKRTGLPISDKYIGSFGSILLRDLKSHRSGLWGTKFFNLEYTALVGDKKYKVKFKY